MTPQPSTNEGVRYRPAAGDADEAAFARILERSFAIPHEASRVLWRRLGADVRVLDDGGDVVACLGWYAAAQWFGGRSIPCAGIAAVGVEPHRRGAGLATRVVAEALREIADGGTPLAALYPSNLALYRGADFEIAGGRYELRTGCAALPRAKDLEPVVPLPSGVLDPRVRALHARVAAARNGWLGRNEALWDRVRDFRGDLREGFGVERGTESPRTSSSRAGSAASGASTSCAATSSRRTAMRAARCSPSSPVTARSPSTSSRTCRRGIRCLALLTAVPDRHAHHHPWMLRVLDVRAAFEAGGFAPNVRGEIHLEVEDALLPRNAGRFVLTVEGGRARVVSGGSGSVRVRRARWGRGTRGIPRRSRWRSRASSRVPRRTSPR